MTDRDTKPSNGRTACPVSAPGSTSRPEWILLCLLLPLGWLAVLAHGVWGWLSRVWVRR